MLVQLDSIDVVLSEQRILPAVRFLVVCSAKCDCVQANVDDLFSVHTHADTVNVMHLRRAVANCAAAIFKAQIQVLSNVVRLRQQTILGRNAPVETKRNQVSNEFSCCRHVAV